MVLKDKNTNYFTTFQVKIWSWLQYKVIYLYTNMYLHFLEINKLQVYASLLSTLFGKS